MARKLVDGQRHSGEALAGLLQLVFKLVGKLRGNVSPPTGGLDDTVDTLMRNADVEVRSLEMLLVMDTLLTNQSNGEYLLIRVGSRV